MKLIKFFRALAGRCPECGKATCGRLYKSVRCEPDLFRPSRFVYSPEYIKLIKEEWGDGVAQGARLHNERAR